jgi:Gas vesicle protein
VSQGAAVTRRDVTLVELVDRVLDRGVVISGDVTLAVADVDLVYLGLRAVVTSVAAAERREDGVAQRLALRAGV